MNLHSIVAPAIGAVNPHVAATWRRSTGYTKDASFKQVPTYSDTTVQIQLQGLSAKELQHLNSIGIQGVLRSIHMNGNAQGVVAETGRGGDLFVVTATGETWLVVQVLETWPEWSRVAVCLQST